MIRTLTWAALAVAVALPTAPAQDANPRQNPNAAGARPANPAGAQAPNAAARPEANARAGQAANPAAVARAGAGVDDSLFAAAAASGGLAEVAISQLGAQRANDPELKRFSQQMIEDHTRANRELMSLAQQKRIAIPQSPDVRAQFCQQSLSAAPAEEFDRCYAKAQLTAHMDAVAAFESESKHGQDPEIKAWAAKTLPKIKEHLEMIKPIAQRYEKE